MNNIPDDLPEGVKTTLRVMEVEVTSTASRRRKPSSPKRSHVKSKKSAKKKSNANSARRTRKAKSFLFFRRFGRPVAKAFSAFFSFLFRMFRKGNGAKQNGGGGNNGNDNEMQLLHTVRTFREGWYFAALCGICAVILFFIPSKIEFRLLSIIAYAFLVARLHFEIPQTCIAYLFRMGKLQGRLLPGWYFLVPLAYSVRVASREMILLAREVTVITKDKYEVKIRLRLGFQLGDSDKDLEKALYFGDEAGNDDTALEDWLWDVGISKVKSKTGKLTFDSLNSRQDKVEAAVLHDISAETEKNGYHCREAEVVIVSAPVITEVKQREEFAEVAGKEVGEIANAVNPSTVALLLGRDVINKGLPFLLGNSKAAKEVKKAVKDENAIKDVIDTVKNTFGFDGEKDKEGGAA